MTRPAILDLDMAVTPRKSVPLPYDLQDDFCEDPECEHGCAEMRQERDEFNRKHNGPDPAWDDVRKYVEGLEAGHKAVSDFVRVRIPYDQNKDQADCYLAHIGLICRLEERAEVAEARIAELEKRLADAERVIGDFMDVTEPASIPAFKDPQYADEVEMLGERIGFGALIACASASWREVAKRNGHPAGGEFVVGPCMAVLQSVRRAARAYMEGK